MRKTYDVIIAGGGPVGLWLSCELKLAGVDVAVIERRTKRTSQSRALIVHGRTLEVFALRGLADGLLATGKPIPMGHYGVLDTRLDFSPFETRFPYALFIPQAVTEEKLEARAIELGVDILRGHTVMGVADTGDQVHLTTDNFEWTARYVIGADGARSTVRERTGIDFAGFPARTMMILGDVVLDAPPPQPVISIVNEHGCIMIAPLGDGVHYRIVLVDPQRTHVPRSEAVTLEELAAAATRITGKNYKLRNPIWLSRFADETRLASAYRKGRILLAGDAAHIHAPMGGQGMNVGLQDAMNLGWKLAAVVKGHAPASLLDTYGEERRPVGEKLYANTLAQMSLIERFDPTTLALRAMLNDLLKIPAVNRRLAGELSGFDIGYGSEANSALAKGRLAVGVRVPDIDLETDGRKTSLYGTLANGRWLHLAFDADAVAAGPAWLASAAVHSVLAAPVDVGAFRNIRALLVRPDGYVAAIVRPPDRRRMSAATPLR